jgi:hypothetical protein
MHLERILPVLLLAVSSTSIAADDEKIDPAKLKDKVTITMGKQLFVQFEAKGDVLTRPRLVEKAVDRPPTPTFDFRTVQNNPALMTKNPFSKDLKFRALARHRGRRSISRRASCRSRAASSASSSGRSRSRNSSSLTSS